jgi:hypothetical protein
MDHKAKAQRMLKGLTPAEFIKLPLEQRNKIYKRYLVQDEYV